MRKPVWWERYQNMLAQDDGTLRFRTFNVFDKQGNKLSRIQAVSKVTNDEKSAFKVQFSYTCPKDNVSGTYNRHVGRHNALERLNSDAAITIYIDSDQKIGDVIKEALITEATRKDIFWLKDTTVNEIK